ncbi:tyrosine-type recombinase/integrase [Burkholderia gladioli]|uniref:tyrosine-type recombinase/integrase n=1 Tax=Burkholderia gladioli TaxID=28095 RepID=UPI001FC8E338|nr:site-specific integrase [Burkholderia gladioli]
MVNAALAIPTEITAPALAESAGERADVRFLEFFASVIRNPHTRRAYARAAGDFLTWCAGAGVPSIAAVQPLHVAAWVELQTANLSAPTVKQRLAVIRHLFDWLVTGQVVPHNPAASVRGPSHTVRVGKTPVLEAAEARQLLDSLDATTPIGLRDRALIALMVFSFARIPISPIWRTAVSPFIVGPSASIALYRTRTLPQPRSLSRHPRLSTPSITRACALLLRVVDAPRITPRLSEPSKNDANLTHFPSSLHILQKFDRAKRRKFASFGTIQRLSLGSKIKRRNFDASMYARSIPFSVFRHCVRNT